MATYIYETIPSNPDDAPVRFEVRQSMLDKALEHHPETGEPVRRVITGGFGLMGASNGNGDSGGHTHGPSCSSGFR